MCQHSLISQLYTDECSDHEEDKSDHLSECTNGAELHRKVVARAFWNSELEDELREQGQIEYRFESVDDNNKAMEEIDRHRATTVYPHQTCSAECRKRGL